MVIVSSVLALKRNDFCSHRGNYLSNKSSIVSVSRKGFPRNNAEEKFLEPEEIVHLSLGCKMYLSKSTGVDGGSS